MGALQKPALCRGAGVHGQGAQAENAGARVLSSRRGDFEGAGQGATMKPWILWLAPLAAAAAGQTPLQQLFDAKLTPTQRASACFAIRGRSDPEAVAALARALEDPDLLSCAAENLRIAGAVEALEKALSSDAPLVRATAVRTLGSFQKAELLQPISQAAADENAL